MTRSLLCSSTLLFALLGASCQWSDFPSWPAEGLPPADAGPSDLPDAGGPDSDGGQNGMPDAGVPALPTAPAYPACTAPERDASLLAIYSDEYTAEANVKVFPDWNNDIDRGQVSIDGDNMVRYTNFGFAAIEFGQTLDASEKTHLHLDVWTPNANHLQVKLVDFGPDGQYDEGASFDDREFTIRKPIDRAARWQSLDIALDDYLVPNAGNAGLNARENLAQIIFNLDESENGFSSADAIIYLDNIYFYEHTAPTSAEPAGAPCAPQDDADGLFSVYSDAYESAAEGRTFRADWNIVGSVGEISVGSSERVLRYEDLVYASMEFSPMDISEATHLHVDVWSAQASAFKIKLVDFGPDEVYDRNAAVDDVEHELVLPIDFQGRWRTLEIELADFSGLTTQAALAQIIFSSSGEPAEPTLYLDNIYFFRHP